MMAQYILTAVLAILGTIMTVLLTLILGRLSRLEDKLDQKQDKSACDRQLENCEERFSIGGFWDQFNRHSHTGLPADSKVTR